VSAQSAILIDTGSGDIIYELNSRKRLPMASTTKIMTAIVAIESDFPLDKVITVTKQMTGAEGSSIYLYENERFTLYDLIYALLLNSANDAAEAIAISVAGSIKNFAYMMNEKVAELKLKDTNFTNPHGLDNEMHYTTAYDLAKISAYALENEIFAKIADEEKYIIYPKNPDGTDNKAGARFLRNHNKMLRFYKDAIGVKTGFTKRSGRCLVSAAVKNGTRLVAVTLNASNDWNDHIEMLDYGFENYRLVELCKEKEYQFDVNIVNGSKNIIKCENITAESSSLPKTINREDIEYKTELPQFIYAPVKKGDVIGKMIFMYQERIIGISTIVSCENIEINISKKSIINKIKELFIKDKT
jgi:D-alanyl-D-alanine carboxypeptidase